MNAYDLLIPILSAICAGAGAYLGAYLKKKGELRATQDERRQILEQLEAATSATKSIEAKISNEVWDRQMQWEMKKEAVLSIMQTMGKADDALLGYSIAFDTDRSDHTPKSHQEKIDADDVLRRAIEDFEMKRSMALLVCAPRTNEVFMKIRTEMRSGVSRISSGQIRYQDMQPTLSPLIAKAFGAARHELGIPTS